VNREPDAQNRVDIEQQRAAILEAIQTARKLRAEAEELIAEFRRRRKRP
jgi:hypothetical protein